MRRSFRFSSHRERLAGFFERQNVLQQAAQGIRRM